MNSESDMGAATEPSNEPKQATGTEVCDLCLAAAEDEGVDEDIKEQVMMELGADMPDHLCDEVESAGYVRCSCACQIYRK